MEKSEDQIEKEKRAVAAMSNARANMDAALQRIRTLEQALESAKNTIVGARNYVGEYALMNGHQSTHPRVRDWLSEQAANITKVLP